MISPLDQLNPYKNLDNTGPDWLRVSLDVSRSDAFTLYSVLMDRGALRSAMCLFLHDIAQYTKQNNLTITPNDRDKLIDYICTKCNVARPTTSGLNEPPIRPDVGRGTKVVRPRNPRTKNVTTVGEREQTTKDVIESGTIINK